MKQSAFHPYFLDVIQAWQSELQHFLKSEENDLEALLENQLVKELSMSRLKELLDNTLSQQGVIVENNLYSIQTDINVPREYRIELEMDGHFIYNTIVPLNENKTFDDAHSVKAFFEKIAHALFVAIHEQNINEDYEFLTVPENLLNPLKEELDSMEKINRLNFKHFLGAQNEGENVVLQATTPVVPLTEEVTVEEVSITDNLSQEVPETSVEILSKSIDLDLMDDSVDYDFEEDDFEDDTASISVETSEILPVFEEDSEDILLPDFDLVQVPEKLFNFDTINSELNTVFKAVSSSDRETLKAVKATIWELELKQEEEPLEESDFKYLLQNILSVESEEQVVLKWQLNLVRALLNR